MESSAETFKPSRLYVRLTWAASGAALVCVFCALWAPLALIPAALCGLTTALVLWLANRPAIRVAEHQLNIGRRAIAWREIRAINTTRFISPLILDLRLTNNRRKLLVFPGRQDESTRLTYLLRKLSTLSTFDGVAYRDFWTWNTIKEMHGDASAATPIRIVSREEEDEIERLFHKLKGEGSLPSQNEDTKAPREE